MRIERLCLIALMLVVGMAFGGSGGAHAGVVVVGCTTMPVSTIQAAIDSASANDTIIVQPCTHFERLVVNKPVRLVGTSKTSTIIDGQGLGTVILVTSSNVEIQGFTVRGSDDLGWGIRVLQANNVNITGNIVSASPDGDGVNLYKANNTQVNNNLFTANLYGVNVTQSGSVRIIDNQVLNNTYGVLLRGAERNLVSNNTIMNGEEGVDLVDASYNNVTGNLIKRMEIYGISLTPGSPQTLQSEFSEINTISQNNFQRDHIGVSILNATRNSFYGNNFFASGLRQVNTVAGTLVSPNYWDNSSLGGVVGGNYWDDYAGIDADNNGIGDSPYVIGSGNQDTRPLMLPLAPVPVFVKSVLASPDGGTAPSTVSFSAVVLGTLTPLVYSWSLGDGSKMGGSATVMHTYDRAGNYSVSFTVVDAGGSNDSLSTLVEVTGQPPLPPSSPNYAVPIILAILGGAVVAGFLFLRRGNELGGRSGR